MVRCRFSSTTSPGTTAFLPLYEVIPLVHLESYDGVLPWNVEPSGGTEAKGQFTIHERVLKVNNANQWVSSTFASQMISNFWLLTKLGERFNQTTGLHFV